MALRTDKILYSPGEEGVLSVTVKNVAAGRKTGALTVRLGTGLDEAKVLSRRDVSADTGGQTVEVPFTAPRRWGTEVIAEIQCEGTTSVRREYFAAAANFWEVGIGHAYPIFTQGERGRKMVAGMPGVLRDKYSNWLDLFFWAPCDWSKLTPPAKLWWGGQTSYPHDEDNLQALVKALRKNGIRVAAYVTRNAAGPFGWETARAHPDWFGGGRFSGRNYKVEVLDHYNDPEWRAKQKKLNVGWFGVRVDLTKEAPLHYGIDRIIESVDHYGWDAVRFDGHYTTGFDEVSTRNMRRLKERVLKAHPGFRFGYNWGRAPEWKGGFTHELREAMAGGGMYMQEGIRHWNYTRERYRTWSHYAENEMRIAKRIQSLGGYYHCILDLKNKMTPAQRFYKLALTLIAGGHPAYGTHHAVDGSPNWGAFMTRWSELLWHPNLRRSEAAAKQVSVGSEAVKWEPFVQECVLAPDRKRLVVHLLNPPTHDDIGKGKLPPPLERAIPIEFSLPAGQTVRKVWLVRPEAEPFGRPLEVEGAGRRASVTVPGLERWAMVVAEVSGRFTVPPTPPEFTEPPDLARAATGSGSAVGADPNKEEHASSISPAEGFERLLNRGSANIGNPIVDDPDSPLGKVQGRRKDQTKVRMGQWWIGHPVGRYDVILRVKWTDEKAEPTPQKLETSISVTYNPKRWQKATLVTPGYPDAPEDAIVLKGRGQYHDYKIATVDAWWAGCFCFVTDASTTKAGDNQIFQERVIFKLTKSFTDRMLEEHGAEFPERPADLRVPRGASPEKVLVRAGMFWQHYMQHYMQHGMQHGMKDAPFEYELVYELPKDYEGLYEYDAVVLANVDCGGLQNRKLLRDFVADGGRLVLLGGNHALRRSAFAATFVGDALPFTLTKENAVVQEKEPLLLGTRRASPAAGRPALFWRHVVEPRPESTVLAWAGGTPVSFRRAVGKGVVTAFIGTALGTPKGGETPFWETRFWRGHLTALVKE
ncbi:MAG: hypothetical protein ACYS9X_08475 [Planctomycetota bacterium]